MFNTRILKFNLIGFLLSLCMQLDVFHSALGEFSSENPRFAVCDVLSHKCILFKENAVPLCFSDDCNIIVYTHFDINSENKKNVKVWDFKKNTEMTIPVFFDDEDWITAEISPDAKYLLIFSSTKKYCWLFLINPIKQVCCLGQVSSVFFGEDTSNLLTVASEAAVFNSVSIKNQDIRWTHSGSLLHVSRDKKFLLVASDQDQVECFSTESQKILWTTEGFDGRFSFNGKFVFISRFAKKTKDLINPNQKYETKVVEKNTGKFLNQVPGLFCDSNKESDLFTTTGDNNSSTDIWTFSKKQKLRNIPFHICFSPNGAYYFQSIRQDGSMLKIFDVRSGKLVREINSLAFVSPISPDDCWIVSENGLVSDILSKKRIFDVANTLADLNIQKMFFSSFSPDGKKIIFTSEKNSTIIQSLEIQFR